MSLQHTCSLANLSDAKTFIQHLLASSQNFSKRPATYDFIAETFQTAPEAKPCKKSLCKDSPTNSPECRAFRNDHSELMMRSRNRGELRRENSRCRAGKTPAASCAQLSLPAASKRETGKLFRRLFGSRPLVPAHGGARCEFSLHC